jgi:hypothetical protein
MAKNYVSRKKGWKFGVVRKSKYTLQEMEEEHKSKFKQHKQSCVCIKEDWKIKLAACSTHSKKGKRSKACCHAWRDN